MPRRDRALWNASDLTIPEAAQVLRVSVRSVRHYCQQGYLESYVRLLGKPPRRTRLIPVRSLKAYQKRALDGALSLRARLIHKLLENMTEEQLLSVIEAADLGTIDKIDRAAEK